MLQERTRAQGSLLVLRFHWALAISLSISNNILGKGGKGRFVSLDTTPSTTGLVGCNSGDSGGGCDCRASILFKIWKSPSSDGKTISFTLAPPWRCLHIQQIIPLCSQVEVVAMCVLQDKSLCMLPMWAFQVIEAPFVCGLLGATA